MFLQRTWVHGFTCERHIFPEPTGTAPCRLHLLPLHFTAIFTGQLFVLGFATPATRQSCRDVSGSRIKVLYLAFPRVSKYREKNQGAWVLWIHAVYVSASLSTVLPLGYLSAFSGHSYHFMLPVRMLLTFSFLKMIQNHYVKKKLRVCRYYSLVSLQKHDFQGPWKLVFSN